MSVPVAAKLLSALIVLPLLLAPAAGAWVEAAGSGRAPAPPATGDEAGLRLARQVMAAVGGEEGWRRARHVTWSFFGGRRHVWDTWTGDLRIDVPASEDSPGMLVLVNLHDREGRAWRGADAPGSGTSAPVEIEGVELEGPELDAALERAHAWWTNDSYWMFMPFKLLDPGVRVEHRGRRELDGEPVEVLHVTFEDVGLTPENAYDVLVDPETHLVRAWSYHPERPEGPDDEPAFTLPWTGWRWFGPIRLATGHGRGADWGIGVFADLPAEVYREPQPALGLADLERLAGGGPGGS